MRPHSAGSRSRRLRVHLERLQHIDHARLDLLHAWKEHNEPLGFYA